MATDWIPMRCNLPNEPEVLAAAGALGIDAHTVVGKLHCMWSWFDQHTKNGHAQNVTLAQLSRIVLCENFCEQFQKMGWLSVTESGVRMEKFARWLGQGGKRRALTARRASRFRNAKRNAPSVTKSAPTQHNTTQHNNKKATPSNPLPPFPDSLASAEPLWREFLAMRKEIGKPLKPTGAKQAIALLESFGPAKAMEALRNSIAGQWQGIFDPDERKPHASRNSIPTGPGQRYDGRPLGSF